MFVAPRNPWEDALAEIWAEVWGLDQVGVDDNFLDLGGHSLAASRIASRLLQRFGLELSTNALFEAPTVAEMAKLISKH